MCEPQDAWSPRTQMLSLIAKGTPARGELLVAFDRAFLSRSSACFNAPWRSISRNAFNVSLRLSAASMDDSTTERVVVSPASMRSRSSAIVVAYMRDTHLNRAIKPSVPGNNPLRDRVLLLTRLLGPTTARLRLPASYLFVRLQALSRQSQALHLLYLRNLIVRHN